MSTEFIKRDIVEVAEELGIELTEHHTNPVYFTAFCPLHDNTRTPAFAIYPAVQRFYCYSCTPGGGDVIDLVRGMLGVSFVKARDIATIQADATDQLMSKIKRTEPLGVDMDYLQIRAEKVFAFPCSRSFNQGQRILSEFDACVAEGNLVRADRILRHYNL